MKTLLFVYFPLIDKFFFLMISPKENCVSVNSLHCLRADVFSFAIRKVLRESIRASCTLGRSMLGGLQVL